ncbi:MAG: glycosyltransferase [Planctomycetota bacterium]
MSTNTAERVSVAKPEASETIPITAIVVVFNEAGLLPACLEPLMRFDEVIVVDVASTDDSAEVAKELGAHVIEHPWVPFGEKTLPTVIPKAKHDWIVQVDPDEVVPARFLEVLRSTAMSAGDDVAGFKIPFRYYFRGRPIKTTRYGRIIHVPRFFHRKRVASINTRVHSGLGELLKGMTVPSLEDTADLTVRHYWFESWSALLARHRTYLQHEGEARYTKGQRFTWTGLVKALVLCARENLLNRRDIRANSTEWLLAVFILGYETKAHLALRAYQRHLDRRHESSKA